MTLEEVMGRARAQSVEAMSAKQSFVSAYWSYRAYEASRLPSVVLYGNLANFDKSLTLLQNYETGDMVYANTYNMQNSLGLAINQNVTFTGGTLSLYSDLSRIDQFGTNRSLTWYSQPVTISYNQPLFAFNRFKWDKLIEPKEYEKSRGEYLEAMEAVGIDAAAAFFSLLLAKENHRTAVANFENSQVLHSVAEERMRIGSITRDEYLQLEMRMLSDSIQINESSIKVREAQMVINSLLGYDEKTEIEPVLEKNLPDLILDYDFVLDKSLENSKFKLENEIDILKAKSEVAQARANRGISMTLNARFGLSNTASDLGGVYTNPLNQEVVGLGFSVPIFDWGLGKGRVQKAVASQAVAEAKAVQLENDYRRQVFSTVAQFNSQRGQCLVSERAAAIAAERYSLVESRFREGAVSVTELGNARSEKDSAASRYITDLSNFWKTYYTLRKQALYDFLAGEDIEVNEKELINE